MLMEQPEAMQRYDRTTILLHWLTAVLIVLLWTLGQTIDWFPRGTPRVAARSTHILLGLTLVCVVVTRIRWRVLYGRHLPMAPPGAVGYLARFVHYGLYVVVAATLLLGVTNVWVRGDTFFNLFTIPKLDPGNKGLKGAIEDLHALAANSLLILAALHAVAGLWHHFAIRDGILRRMLP